MSLHTCGGSPEADRSCFVCGPGIKQQDKIDALQAEVTHLKKELSNIDPNTLTFSPLRSEVDRLRVALEKIAAISDWRNDVAATIAKAALKLSQAPPLSQKEIPMNPEDLNKLVDRFLTWPLPKTVCSDQCVTERNYPHQRSGTNLLTADEARQMLEHVLGVAKSGHGGGDDGKT